MTATSSPRKHITTACKSCRDSKIKCDGNLPACANCIRRARSCLYETGDDKRRLPFRSALGILRERVQQLQDALENNGCSSLIPPISSADRDTVNKTLVGIGLEALSEDLGSLPSGQLPSTEIPAIRTEQIENFQAPSDVPSGVNEHSLPLEPGIAELEDIDWSAYSFSPPDWPWMGLFVPDTDQDIGTAISQATNAGTLELPSVGNNADEPLSMTRRAQSSSEDEDGNVSSGLRTPAQDEVDPELVGQIAARVGSLRRTADGQLRYCGAPTNANIFGAVESANLPPSSRSRSVKGDGRRLLRQADLDKPFEADIANHLLSLFFSWHNSCHPVVDEAVFWDTKRQYLHDWEHTGLYSEVLDNVMCAIGANHDARYHPRLVTFPRTLAEFFAERAKVLLEIELDSPCLPTVQALILLSSYEVGHQRLARSWLYSGTCCPTLKPCETARLSCQMYITDRLLHRHGNAPSP